MKASTTDFCMKSFYLVDYKMVSWWLLKYLTCFKCPYTITMFYQTLFNPARFVVFCMKLHIKIYITWWHYSKTLKLWPVIVLPACACDPVQPPPQLHHRSQFSLNKDSLKFCDGRIAIYLLLWDFLLLYEYNRGNDEMLLRGLWKATWGCSGMEQAQWRSQGMGGG